MWLSTTELAKRSGVSTQTIRRNIESGKYKEVKKTAGGHYRVRIIEERRLICYARVSSSKQRSSLDRQVELLRERYPEAEYICDTSSSFNFKRKGIKTILECTLSGVAVHLVATTQDRIARSGYELIKQLIELSGGTIELLDESNEAENFSSTELISFITSFCNSYYGKRSASRRKNKGDQKDPDISGE